MLFLSELLILMTVWQMSIKIWLAAAVSFIAALCSSLIPLADMQKKSLVDLIRTVD